MLPRRYFPSETLFTWSPDYAIIQYVSFAAYYIDNQYVKKLVDFFIGAIDVSRYISTSIKNINIYFWLNINTNELYKLIFKWHTSISSCKLLLCKLKQKFFQNKIVRDITSPDDVINNAVASAIELVIFRPHRVTLRFKCIRHGWYSIGITKNRERKRSSV